jgi:hypothetical protein
MLTLRTHATIAEENNFIRKQSQVQNKTSCLKNQINSLRNLRWNVTTTQPARGAEFPVQAGVKQGFSFIFSLLQLLPQTDPAMKTFLLVLVLHLLMSLMMLMMLMMLLLLMMLVLLVLVLQLLMLLLLLVLMLLLLLLLLLLLPPPPLFVDQRGMSSPLYACFSQQQRERLPSADHLAPFWNRC